MDFDNHLHFARHLHLKKFIHNSFYDLVASDTFRRIAISMISLFIPIFLLKIGYDLNQIILFYILFYFSMFLSQYLILKNIHIVKVKRAITISYFFNIVLNVVYAYNVELISFFGMYGYLLLILIFNIAVASFYWGAHHIFFIKSTQLDDEGKKLALVNTIPILGGIIAPFLGGLFITYLGFKFVFILSSILLLFAVGILNESKEISVDKQIVNNKEIFSLKNRTRSSVFIIHSIIKVAVMLYWPLFLFISSIKLLAIGFVSMISSLFYVLLSYITGFFLDKKSSSKISLLAGSSGFSLSLIMRTLMQTMFSITFMQSIGGIFKAILDITIDSNFFRKSHKNVINSILNREFCYTIGRISTLIMLFVLLSLVPTLDAFMTLIILAGVLTLILNILVKNNDLFVSQ